MMRSRVCGWFAAALTAAVALLPSLATPPVPAAPQGAATGLRAQEACAPDPTAPKRQLRGEWIATVGNLDWPSRPGLSVAQQQAELLSWYDEAVARRLNAVVLQVRPTADTFWPSRLEPWSKYLTGTQGQDPGYDPLRFAVRQAHKRNLEFHAWFNPYRVSLDTDRSALAPGNPARVHPDWVVAYGGRLYFNPGVPAVRKHIENVIMEVVNRYDVDAIHLDDYFYPYPSGKTAFPDAATFAKYGAGFANRADWRRHNVDLLISELNTRIHAAKPWVKLGVSPFAVWRNRATDPTGSATTAAVQTNEDHYADTRKWVRHQWVDYIAPQVYWNIGFKPADYAVLVPWWSRQARGTNVQLYVGQATYKVGTSTQDPAWSDPREMTRHLFLNQRHPQVRGDIYFSAKDVRADRLGNMHIVQADHYRHPALIPRTAGVPGRAPLPPRALRVHHGARVTLTWRGRGTSYAIYRFAAHGLPARCALADASHLIATMRRTPGPLQKWTVPAGSPARATYVVTALDRAYRESRPSAPAR
jgi:uncharacterized lipoprotein YddW (UPF0748 family)